MLFEQRIHEAEGSLFARYDLKFDESFIELPTSNLRLSGRETSLLGQLKQAYLDGDVPMAGVQLPDLIHIAFPFPG